MSPGGVCVIATFDGTEVEDATVLAMAAAAGHRGPATLRRCGRDAAGAQQSPAGGPDLPTRETGGAGDGVFVAADARIDNVAELRSALARRGLPIALESPAADIIGAAYRAWGPDCAARIVGDFAFVVWDAGRRRLVAARDPLAMRPLYYRVEPRRRVLLATEVKQLLVAPGVPVRIDERAVAADLVAHFGLPGWSFYDGIEQLAPGHVLVVDTDTRRLERFWDVDGSARIEAGAQEAAELVRRTFVDAVSDRLRGGAPAGVLLSGGMDSGSVAATAGWLVRRGLVAAPLIHAFSWAFDELTQCDERHISRHIVDGYGLPATDVPADDAGPLACYPKHLPDRDDPFLGAFQPLIEHGLAAGRAAGVTVMLGGDRGDLVVGDTGMSYLRMLQAGDVRDLRLALAEHRRTLHDPLPTMARRYFLDAVAGRVRRRSPRQWAAWAGRRLRGHGPAAPGPPDWVDRALLRRSGVTDTGEPAAPAGLDPARAQRYRMIFTPLHLRGVAWSDRTYARFGLGFADPFSDRRLVELAVALPQVVINRPGDQTKPLMRAAMRGVMPEAARRAAHKILPTPLYERGLRARRDVVVRLLTNPQVAARGWVDAAAWRRHYEQWFVGGDLRPEFWWTLQVELWLRTHWA